MANILIVTNTLCFGGAESFSVQLYEQLSQQNHNVSYAIFSNDVKILDRFPEISTDKIHKFSLLNKTSSVKMLAKIFEVKKYLEKNNIDTVYCCQPDSALVFWILRLFNKKVKIVYITMHVYGNADSKERLIWKTGIPNLGTDIFIGLSEYLSLELKNKNKVTPSKVVINRLPVDIDKFKVDSKSNRTKFGLPLDKKIVGVCCRLYPIKRVHLFIEAFRYIQNDDVIGVIYGEGSEKDELLRLINEYDLSEKIILNPFIDNANEVIPMFDLYLQTGSGPNLGLVTLEAFSSGVPVIMIADNEEEVFMINDTYCNQKVGEIATSDPKNIASKVMEILNDPEIDQMSVRCRKLAEDKYSWPVFLSVNDEIIKKIK